MTDLPVMSRLTDHSLGLSIEAPADWSGTKDSALHLALFAPEQRDYSANVRLELKHVEPPDAEGDWFVRVVEQAYYQGGIGLAGYQLVEAFTVELDGHPGFLARYEWVAEEFGLHFSQVDTLVLLGPTSLLEIHGVGLKELEWEHLPVLLYIIHSIRFEPPQPPSEESS
jgi:hypothetical protein